MNEILEKLEKMIKTDLTQTVEFRILSHLREAFRKRGLPVKHLGKIKIQVDNSFWENEYLANQVIEKFSDVVLKIYAALVDEFGEDADFIFPDFINGMGIIKEGV
jgi:hypothetical protein